MLVAPLRLFNFIDGYFHAAANIKVSGRISLSTEIFLSAERVVKQWERLLRLAAKGSISDYDAVD